MTLARDLERGDEAPGQAARLALDYPRRTPLVEAGRLRRRRSWTAPDAELLVRPGDRAGAGDAVARAPVVGRAAAVDVARSLGVSPDRAAGSLNRRVGETIAEGEPLAERRSLGGLQRRTLRAPAGGRLSYVSTETGIAYIEPLAGEARIAAHLDGEVVAVAADSALIEGEGIALAGTAGAGPAVAGILVTAESPEALPEGIDGAIVACGFALDEGTIGRLADAGAAAVVAAGIEETAIAHLGWDDLLWADGRQSAPPAPPFTVVLLAATAAAPPAGVWDLLRSLGGRGASAVGAEHGAPCELIVSLAASEAAELATRCLGTDRAGGHSAAGIGVGQRASVLAGRADGLTGEVEEIGGTPYRLASEVHTDVATVVFPYDVRLRVPLLHLRALR